MKTSFLILFSFVLTFGQAQEFIRLKVKSKRSLTAQYANSDDFVAVSSGDQINLYNQGSGVLVRELKGIKGDVTSIGWNRTSSQLAAGSQGGIIRVWNVETGMGEYLFNIQDEIIRLIYIDPVRIAYCTESEVGLINLSENKIEWSKASDDEKLRAFDANDKHIAAGGSEGVVYLFDLYGNPTKQYKMHNNWVRSLAFHPSGNLLASGSDDGTVSLWDLEGPPQRIDKIQGRIYGLAFSKDGSILAYASHEVAFYSMDKKYKVFENKNFNSTILHIDFSPNGRDLITVEDLVPDFKVWNIASLNISPYYISTDKSDQNAPQIFVANPSNIQKDYVRISKDIITLRGTVLDDAGVRSLKVNNIETPVRENGSYLINLPLSPGDNYVTIEATDVNDNIALRKFIIDRQNAENFTYRSEEARNFLFVVGINDYEYWPKLNNAVKDASDITSVLLSKYNFNFEHVTLIKNSQATRANIIGSLRSLIEKITPQDNLMIYYSGHGYFDELLNEGYWVPVDAPKNAVGDYIPNQTILTLLDNIDSQHTFLVADACFSGSLFAAGSRGYVDNVEKFKSRWGLASGRLEVVSDGAVGNNSPFATHFIEYLQKNEKDRFAVSELVQYVKIYTAEDSDQTPIGNPLKSLGDEGGEFIFYRKK